MLSLKIQMKIFIQFKCFLFSMKIREITEAEKRKEVAHRKIFLHTVMDNVNLIYMNVYLCFIIAIF
jgi:hypothetical protein